MAKDVHQEKDDSSRGMLGHLLEVEAQASSLVNDAETEAARRIHENEEKNRIAYEHRFKEEIQKQEESLLKEKEIIRAKYQKELDDYRKEIDSIKVDEDHFSALLNEFLLVKNPQDF
ncbi:MAG: hypothetical protein FWB86_00090 [Treponema sp.]|nr:hypothetical protein [Treponema sp.]MCL2251549.1 hypothetical protein [Treponema sp.]